MRTTIIPAQVTTVEDTIAGNLTLTQIILLIIPVMGSTAIYALLPTRMVFTAYKIPLTIVFVLTFLILAIRIRGRLVLNWLVIFATFLSRPHLYVFSKNTTYGREIIFPKVRRRVKSTKVKKVKPALQDSFGSYDINNLARNTNFDIRFTKKGLLVVKNT